ncbi:MAG TPA: zf-HC2 domain-containing protein [Longimicrobiales bacterium]|nr:zf-HC2 domain-containing protein [Longimicrobiales bacterium]
MTNDVMSCEEALRQLATLLDGELDADTAGEVERHLARCRTCYSRAEFERQLRQAVARLCCEPAGDALQRRVRQLIAGFPPATTP